jgi:hypothetical protein
VAGETVTFASASVSIDVIPRIAEISHDAETKNSRSNERRFHLLPELPEIQPIPLRQPEYFAQCYTAKESREDNRLAKVSVIRVPNDLE